MSDVYLVDTNLLLRLRQPNSPFHLAALNAITSLIEQGNSVCISAQNLIEFWSVDTRPVASNGFGLSLADAASERRRLEQDFDFLPDTEVIYPVWCSLIEKAGVSGKQVHDARLVAICHTYAVPQLLTFNTSDFVRFVGIEPGLSLTHPKDIAEVEGNSPSMAE